MNHTVTEYKMLGVTLMLKFVSLFAVPQSATVANWLVSISAAVTIFFAIRNNYFKKNK